MLSAARAARLAARAGRRRADGSQGLRARHAWRRLVRAGDRGDATAIEAVWQAWPRDPRDEPWAALTRWRERQVLAEAVFSAAMAPHASVGYRSAIGAFCARHGIAPAGPADRVLFYVMTGQTTQHRAADPDGALLAAVYQGASPEIRGALRASLAGTGDIDLVHVVASRRDRVLSADEHRYLQDQLASRRDWPALWRLVLDQPLTEAVAAMRRFGDGWRPEGDRERAVFQLLTRTSPAELTTALDALSGQTRWFPTYSRVRAGTLSPDGRTLAVWETGKYSERGRVLVFALPDVKRIAERRTDGPACLAYAADTLLVADSPPPGHGGTSRLRRYRDGGWTEVSQAGRVTALAPCRTGPERGFAVLAGSRLHLCDRDGEIMDTVPLDELADQESARRTPEHRWRLASEPGGQLAIAAGDVVIVLRADRPRSRPLTCWRAAGEINGICFCGPERVITTSRPRHVETLPAGARADVAGAFAPVAFPLRQEVAVLGNRGDVRYLNATTLAPADVTPDEERGRLGNFTGSCMFGTPDGRYHGMGGERSGFNGQGFVVIKHSTELITLAETPRQRWRPADLATVRRAAPLLDADDRGRPLASLLLACLEHRFGTEVAIGHAAPVPGEDDFGITSCGSTSRGPDCPPGGYHGPVDPETVDQNYAQLQQQAQQTAAQIQTLAGKLQTAAAAGDPNAREWMLDLKEITLGIQQEQGQVSLLLQSIHSMVNNHVQTMAQPQYQQPQYQQPGYQQGGGMLQQFLGGGFGRAIMTGAGFGIGDDIINKIF